MTVSPPPPPPRPEAANCEKCGQPTTLMTVIQRLGDTPGYRIFECRGCNILTWVPEKIAG
jgi:DNA-directed RNA polymerase subunit M/transcription elongation factor TFIIS